MTEVGDKTIGTQGNRSKHNWDFCDKVNKFEDDNQQNTYNNMYSFPISTKGNRQERIETRGKSRGKPQFMNTITEGFKNTNISNLNANSIGEKKTIEAKLPRITGLGSGKYNSAFSSKGESMNTTKMGMTGNNYVPHSLLSALATDIHDSRNTVFCLLLCLENNNIKYVF